MIKKSFLISMLITIMVSIFITNSVVNADDYSDGTWNFTIQTTFDNTQLVANQMIFAKVTATNVATVPFSGTRDVLLIAALYDSNNSMVNYVYITRGLEYQDFQTFTAGMKMPSSVTGYKLKTFVWDGTDIRTSNMMPLSNVVELN